MPLQRHTRDLCAGSPCSNPPTSHSRHVSCPSDSSSCIFRAANFASSYADGLIRNSSCVAARRAVFTTGDLAALRMKRQVRPFGPGLLGQSTAVSFDLTAASKRSSYATSPNIFAAGWKVGKIGRGGTHSTTPSSRFALRTERKCTQAAQHSTARHMTKTARHEINSSDGEEHA